MSRSVRVIAPAGSCAGFALAGFATIAAASAQTATAALTDLLDDPSTGVVLIDESLYRDLDDEVRRRLGRRSLPMVVPFPSLVSGAEPGIAESYVVDLLRQVIGYRVRLR